MAPLKSFLLVSSGIASALTCSNDNCEAGDQTALLQSHLTRKSELALSSTGAAFFPKLGNLNDPSTRKSALLEIQKTAVKLASMDKSEATPVVIEVCTDTAQMLNETVLYAIIQEDAVDRAELASAYSQFALHELEIMQEGSQAQIALAEAQQLIVDTAADLKLCRVGNGHACTLATEVQGVSCGVSVDEAAYIKGEADLCTEITTCESEEHGPCGDCEEHCRDNCEVSGSLCQIDREIQDRWCVGSTEPERMADTPEGLSWRTETKTLFDRYTAQVEFCTGVQGCCTRCTDITTGCVDVVTRYQTKAHQCNSAYQAWEIAKCQEYTSVAFDLATYQQGFQSTLAAYNDVVARVMIEEADRKVEWEVLTRVICLLLTLTNTEDGDAASADNQALIQRCWDEPVDTTHLDIDYLPAPSMEGIPQVDVPCTPPFVNPEFGVDVVDIVFYRPSEACDSAMLTEHSTALRAGTAEGEGCNCPSPSISLPEFQLGHFLLIDPSVADISTQLAATQWTAQIFGANTDSATAMVGSMSSPHVGALPDVTSDFFSQEEIDAGSVIASVSWAYGSVQPFPEGALTLEERFAQNGGLMYMDSAGTVIATRELASSSTDLNQAATAFMSFELSKDITAAEFTDTCGTGHDVTNSNHRLLGAEKYCWTQGALSGDGWSCTEGCFVYQTTTGHVAFPHFATTSVNAD